MNKALGPRRLWRPADGLVVLLVLVAAGILFWLSLPTDAPQTVIITTPTGEETWPLENRLLTVVGRDDHRVTVEITPQGARFQEADCPDRVCVNTGWLEQAGDTAACVPAGIVLRIAGAPAVDGVVG